MDFSKQGRYVYVKRSAVDTAAITTGFIFTTSVFLYYTKVFKHTRNIPQFGAFTLGSLIVANFWGRFLGLNPVHEAILINNQNE
jgi:FtsH-binding integral membrane protein